jgi:iron complex transport system ATP-binding protein
MGELSGGERQRVIIAMALAQEPDVLLLDEPTSFLDIKHQVKIQGLLVRLREEKGLTVVSALHDLTMASTYFDRLCLLADGQTVKIGPPSEVMQYQLIKDAYGTEVYIDVNTVTGRPYIIPLCDPAPPDLSKEAPEGAGN